MSADYNLTHYIMFVMCYHPCLTPVITHVYVPRAGKPRGAGETARPATHLGRGHQDRKERCVFCLLPLSLLRA